MFGMGGSKPQPQPAEGKRKMPAKKQPALVAVTVKLSAEQKEHLEALGGDAWLREQLDRAKPDDSGS